MKGAIGKLMQQAQEELANMEVTGEAGAGLVKVVMTGKHEVRRVTIDPTLFEEDRDILEDLIAAACNDAVQRVTRETQEKMSSLSGGLNLPEGMNFPGMG